MVLQTLWIFTKLLEYDQGYIYNNSSLVQYFIILVNQYSCGHHFDLD